MDASRLYLVMDQHTRFHSATLVEGFAESLDPSRLLVKRFLPIDADVSHGRLTVEVVGDIEGDITEPVASLVASADEISFYHSSRACIDETLIKGRDASAVSFCMSDLPGSFPKHLVKLRSIHLNKTRSRNKTTAFQSLKDYALTLSFPLVTSSHRDYLTGSCQLFVNDADNISLNSLVQDIVASRGIESVYFQKCEFSHDCLMLILSASAIRVLIEGVMSGMCNSGDKGDHTFPHVIDLNLSIRRMNPDDCAKVVRACVNVEQLTLPPVNLSAIMWSAVSSCRLLSELDISQARLFMVNEHIGRINASHVYIRSTQIPMKAMLRRLCPDAEIQVIG